MIEVWKSWIKLEEFYVKSQEIDEGVCIKYYYYFKRLSLTIMFH